MFLWFPHLKDVEGKHCAMFDFSWTDIDHLTFQVGFQSCKRAAHWNFSYVHSKTVLNVCSPGLQVWNWCCCFFGPPEAGVLHLYRLPLRTHPEAPQKHPPVPHQHQGCSWMRPTAGRLARWATSDAAPSLAWTCWWVLLILDQSLQMCDFLFLCLISLPLPQRGLHMWRGRVKTEPQLLLPHVLHVGLQCCSGSCHSLDRRRGGGLINRSDGRRKCFLDGTASLSLSLFIDKVVTERLLCSQRLSCRWTNQKRFLLTTQMRCPGWLRCSTVCLWMSL